jgi:hypothetical protein
MGHELVDHDTVGGGIGWRTSDKHGCKPGQYDEGLKWAHG